MTKSRYLNEIEIKVNRYDLKRDHEKWHGHRSKLIKRLFFAIPWGLVEFTQFIPENAGILVVSGNGYCDILRPARINRDARPINDKEVLHLGMLASMRIWTLKETLKNKDQDSDMILWLPEQA